ncbi:hypothetical protein Glove_443g65 [Diversispora epigaea]|uniref:Uncharacterized protein n=1 Tax=Diversispora epigaea TaxID=1348612 RepID=A0A397GRU7_9GLOM|nr:hypothetical protein Glove_443g65 [Diversispora epigaea]
MWFIRYNVYYFILLATKKIMAIFTDKRAVDNTYLEAMFVALFTLFIIWAVGIVISELLRTKRDTSNTTNAPTVPPAERTDVISTNRMDSRSKKATNAVRDAFLMLTVAILTTLAGYGATKAAVILTWIFFGLVILLLLSILLADLIWITLIFQLLAFPLIIAILSLAFKD